MNVACISSAIGTHKGYCPCVLHMSSYEFFHCIRSSLAFHRPSGTSIRLRSNWALWLNSKSKFPMMEIDQKHFWMIICLSSIDNSFDFNRETSRTAVSHFAVALTHTFFSLRPFKNYHVLLVRDKLYLINHDKSLSRAAYWQEENLESRHLESRSYLRTSLKISARSFKDLRYCAIVFVLATVNPFLTTWSARSELHFAISGRAIEPMDGYLFLTWSVLRSGTAWRGAARLRARTF